MSVAAVLLELGEGGAIDDDVFADHRLEAASKPIDRHEGAIEIAVVSRLVEAGIEAQGGGSVTGPAPARERGPLAAA